MRNNRIYVSSILGLGIVEFAINFPALQNLGEQIPNLLIIPIALQLVFAILICAHYFGKLIISGDKVALRWIVLTSAGFLGVVIFLRFGLGNSVELSLLNVAIFSLSAFLSYRRHYDPGENIRGNERQERLELARLSSEYAAVQLQVDTENKIIDLKSALMPLEKAGEEQRALNEELSACDLAEQQINQTLENSISKIDSIEAASLATIESEDERIKNVVPDFKSSSWLSKAKSVLSSNGANMLLAGLIVMLASGCMDLKKTEALVVYDLTIDKADKPAAADVLKLFEDMAYGRVTIASIDNRSMGLRYPANLMKPPLWIFQTGNVEDTDRAKFEDDFIKGWNASSTPTKDYKQTQIYGPLTRHLLPLARSDADIKIAICFTDFFENYDDIFSFYEYTDDPSRMRKEYEQIAGKLEAEYPDIKNVPLNGISILAIHLPHEEKDRLHKNAREFWGWYFTNKGATIEFLPNIPNALPIAQN